MSHHSSRMHPYAPAKKMVTFENFYNDTRKFDPADFSGRQLAYTDEFVASMPPDSGARRLHDQVLALHDRADKLSPDQADYWNGPGEDDYRRVYVVENVPVYPDGGENGFDLGIWLPEMLECVKGIDPFYYEEPSDDEDATEDENATEDDETADELKRVYFFPDEAKRKEMSAKLRALEEDIGALMESIGLGRSR